MKRQFPVTVGVFVASFSALGCGVSDSEIPNRGWWTGDASVSSDASSPSENTDAATAPAADGGARDVQIIYYDDYTYVTASVLATRLDPIPPDGSTVPGGPIQLQWTLPESSGPAGVVTCDVYFGTNSTVEANPRVVIGQAVESVAVTLALDTQYYWALDVYDSVLMCVHGPLSEASIAQGGVPVNVPDFTRGRWKTRRPRFALDQMA